MFDPFCSEHLALILFSYFSSIGTSLYQAVQKWDPQHKISKREKNWIKALNLLPAAMLLLFNSRFPIFLDSWMICSLGIAVIVSYLFISLKIGRIWTHISSALVIFSKVIILFYGSFYALTMGVFAGRTWLPLPVILIFLAFNCLPYLIPFALRLKRGDANSPRGEC